MKQSLDFRLFAHSWVSDWNHGNAHFLRGLARSLLRMGHKVRCYEELGAWSLSNLVREEGERAIEAVDQFRAVYPELDVQFYRQEGFEEFAARELRGADVVLVHEWNTPKVVNTIAGLKRQLGFSVLFHDTHHRAYTRAHEILRFHLHLFDGVLAFGEAIRRIYADGFGVPKVWTFHEGADIENFYPRDANQNVDVIWIGNWGDEERTRELEEFLIEPAAMEPRRNVVVHGVRYPENGLRRLREAGVDFRGYLPNLLAPAAYSQSMLTVHVPRRQYTNGLSGIPTIRVFEALACGTPLLCAPWSDSEGLFRPGQDYLCARDGAAMKAEIERLLHDEGARRQLSRNGMETIRRHHTCAHRAQQLLEICEELGR
jgi:spore maturation protein CgeB